MWELLSLSVIDKVKINARTHIHALPAFNGRVSICYSFLAIM